MVDPEPVEAEAGYDKVRTRKGASVDVLAELCPGGCRRGLRPDPPYAYRPSGPSGLPINPTIDWICRSPKQRWPGGVRHCKRDRESARWAMMGRWDLRVVDDVSVSGEGTTR